MKFLDTINHFYYQMSLRELRMTKDAGSYKELTNNSMVYLDVISQTEQCTVSKLADALGITKSAVTMKVNELVKRGFLVKTQSATDKRVFYLTLHPEMQDIYDRFDNIFTSIGRKMERKYTPEELSLFCRMLSDVADCEWEGFDE